MKSDDIASRGGKVISLSLKFITKGLLALYHGSLEKALEAALSEYPFNVLTKQKGSFWEDPKNQVL